MKRCGDRGGRGFSLIEMLIVCTLVGLISTVVAVLFHKGQQIYRHGEAHIEMQRSGRHLVSRLGPYVSSAFDVDSPTTIPVESPAAVGQTSPVLEFYTTEDWFAVGYPSRFTSASEVTAMADLRKYKYRVRLVNDATETNHGSVVIERLEIDPGPPIAFLATVTSPARDHTRVLLRASQGQTIENFSFSRPPTLSGAGMLQLQFTTSTAVRGAVNGSPMMPIREDFRVTFSLPQHLNS